MTKKANSWRREIVVIGLLFFGVFAVGVSFYHTVEDLGFLDATYFTAMTLTTVGYGDFTPLTDAGKLFTTFYAFLGIGFFLGFANVVFRSALNYSHNHHREE